MSFIRSKDSAVRARRQFATLLWLLLVSSCQGTPTQALPSQAPTPTRLSVSAISSAISPGAQSTTTYAPIVTITPPAQNATATKTCAPDPAAPHTRYDVDAVVDWETRSANGVMH